MEKEDKNYPFEVYGRLYDYLNKTTKIVENGYRRLMDSEESREELTMDFVENLASCISSTINDIIKQAK